MRVGSRYLELERDVVAKSHFRKSMLKRSMRLIPERDGLNSVQFSVGSWKEEELFTNTTVLIKKAILRESNAQINLQKILNKYFKN